MDDQQILELIKANPSAGAVVICAMVICMAWIVTTMIKEMSK